MTVALAGLVLEAWDDLDRAVEGLSAEDAERRIGDAKGNPLSRSLPDAGVEKVIGDIEGCRGFEGWV